MLVKSRDFIKTPVVLYCDPTGSGTFLRILKGEVFAFELGEIQPKEAKGSGFD
jgi:hypothetical protein